MMFEGKDFLIFFRKTQGFFSLVVDLGSCEWCIRLLSRLFHLNRKGVWELRTISRVTGLRTISGGAAPFVVQAANFVVQTLLVLLVGFHG